jgi:hypothetical protein
MLATHANRFRDDANVTVLVAAVFNDCRTLVRSVHTSDIMVSTAVDVGIVARDTSESIICLFQYDHEYAVNDVAQVGFWSRAKSKVVAEQIAMQVLAAIL